MELPFATPWTLKKQKKFVALWSRFLLFRLLTRTGSLVPRPLSADMSHDLQRPCEVSARDEGCSARHDPVRVPVSYTADNTGTYYLNLNLNLLLLNVY